MCVFECIFGILVVYEQISLVHEIAVVKAGSLLKAKVFTLQESM